VRGVSGQPDWPRCHDVFGMRAADDAVVIVTDDLDVDGVVARAVEEYERANAP